jgi:methionyl-tRNA formyltransferase
LRLVFAGTPEPALPSLRALLDSPSHDVVAVVTRPDAPAGRGRRLTPSPVNEVASAAGVEVLTPARPSEPEFLRRLRDLAPDCCPVVAYGALIPPAALEIPPEGWVNLHFSVLPAWRGAAPVQHALLAGDDITGATTFRLEAGLDTGPVFGVVTARIGTTETAGELTGRLATDGAGLLLATLDGIADGSLVAVPQPPEGVSLAPKFTTDDARVRWTDPAVAVDRRVRACTPAPGAWTTFRGERLGLGPVRPQPDAATTDAATPDAATPDAATPDARTPGAGVLSVGRDAVLVGAGSGSVRLTSVRPPGRAEMDAAAWARGARPQPDERLE